MINLINCSLEKGIFHAELKIAIVSPICRKNNNLGKKNYRPASILPHLSKIYERIIYKQIENSMDPKFSPYVCVFRKSFDSQYALFKMKETWKQHHGKGNQVGVLLMGLPKAFATMNRSLFLAKLEAYSFSAYFLKPLHSYLSK